MKNIEIDHGKPFDWGRASREYARYRDIYPPAFYEKILGLGLCRKGQKVLDLGTGPACCPGISTLGERSSPAWIFRKTRLPRRNASPKKPA